MLGQQWFAGRIWTFDYPRRQLLLLESVGEQTGHEVKLGFPTNDHGERGSNFARLNVQVEGEELPLLLDTGASTTLTAPALQAVADGGPSRRATSFITSSVFQRWREAHPDWRVIEKAEMRTGEAMIEVPVVTVAGYRVGPVWFTRRADPNFHEWMSSMMDSRVEGALGGNALRHFKITVDYPGARAWFER